MYFIVGMRHEEEDQQGNAERSSFFFIYKIYKKYL
eukprot:SAG11_NODE_26697_length_342_cov_0.629630_1_plen_34_part_01